ncbi:MAG: ABC transporter ATP-binding protein [Bacteroidales bacterium]|nr:ABC transporter ATP-binding protein [Bacteroidales bacterium]HNW74085.1 ABC transporter ATP-binding protein [Bacteroidales bacterium]HPS51108.1 ABC transporter ATP-binding protein [Bacteroidales bacterium]
MNLLEINHLCKFYGGSLGIDDLNLSVAAGDIFGFIGPNGAGKSTTIRILLNLIFPTSGSARIFGLDVVRDSKKIRSRTGYVPSDASIYDRMKVMDFLKYVTSFYRVDNIQERIDRLLEVFDLDPGRKIAELSMGNKKKVSIIQAMIHRPELLILDEPTSGLDPLIQSRFFDLLHEENRQGTTIFFSSHTLSEVQSFCKTVAIIKEGKIVAVEEIATLRKKQLKKIQIHFPESRNIRDLGIQGIGQAESDRGRKLVFMFSGSINDLIGKLASQQIENLSIEEPSLEEIFLHYYK